MGLGGVLLAGLGIIMVVLVANGRWPSVWAAMLGASAATGASANTSLTSTTYGVAGNGTIDANNIAGGGY